MLDLKACTVCFSTEVKLYNMDTGQLRQTFNVLSGLQTYQGNGMPNYLCVECSSYIKRFKKFRLKCQTANYVMREIIQRNSELKSEDLKAVDRNALDIAPTLSYVNLSKVYFEEVKFRWTRPNRLGLPNKDDIPVVNYNDQAPQNFNKEIKIESKDVFTEDYVEIPSSVNNEYNNYDDNDGIDNEGVDDDESVEPAVKKAKTDEADGSELDLEFATLYPITMKEGQAAAEVFRMFSVGKHKCHVCSKSFNNESRLGIHLRMHDTHVSGPFRCDVCMYYYKTPFLLKTHMTDKHMYKYVCRKCPEVNFTRVSAKHHYTYSHLDKNELSGTKWTQRRPDWQDPRGGKRTKGSSLKAKRKRVPGTPADFPLREAVSQEEQYNLVLERKSSRNYIESQFKCELCYKGFRVLDTYNKHMTKHDPAISGKLQCDVCKMFFKDTRKMYKHMIISHVIKYSCQLCKHVCYNRNQAIMHYKWHNNVTYKCPHCDKVFSKISTHLTHIRIKHPSSFMCNLCGHSFVSETGLYCHKRIAHTVEEAQISNSTEVDPSHPFFCADCNIHFLNEDAFNTHLGSSNKHATTNESIKTKARDIKRLGDKRSGGRRGRPSKSGHSDIINNGLATSTSCELCGKYLPNDVQTRHHYETEHPGHDYLKRYMCDVCGHTTKQYANLVVHMRTHTNEKPYDCPHCDRRFSMGSNRDRHLVVHTGEKRYQCHHCNRRFTQSSAVKLHIQTVHLKIPYAPWDKKNRKRRKELEGTSAPVSTVNSLAFPPQQKLMVDTQGDYLNAYINYNE